MLFRFPHDREPAETLTTRSRFECKYIVDPLILPALRQFLSAVARPDPFALAHPDHRYSVCSLYLDTDDLLFYRQYVRGERHRFKLRVRTYSDDPETPAFLEVKARNNRVILKHRVRLAREEARQVVRRRSMTALAGRLCHPGTDLDYFANEMALFSCKPVVRVGYVREAYVAPGHEPVRVTFDTFLRHQATFTPNFAHDGGHWTPTPVGGVVLEIKFTGRFPSWVEHLVRAFGLRQERCCKFAMSIEHMLSRGGATLDCAGFRLPPAALGVGP